MMQEKPNEQKLKRKRIAILLIYIYYMVSDFVEVTSTFKITQDKSLVLFCSYRHQMHLYDNGQPQ